jgi:signal transduction histidine kinase
LDRQVRDELVRVAYRDSVVGSVAAFGIALLFAAILGAALPAGPVLVWLAFALAVNLARGVLWWNFRRRATPELHRFDVARFVGASALAGLLWGVGVWFFYPAVPSEYQTAIVLVLAGLTTGAARLLVPMPLANLAYLYFAVLPLMARFLTAEAPLAVTLGLAGMSVFYLVYMTLAAVQQYRTLRGSLRLGFENAALASSLSGEIARRSVIEDELRTASEQAQAASRAKSEFLATMSHEIRTPMNGFMGMLQLLRETESLTVRQRELVSTASDSAEALHGLLNDLLDFSKIEAGRLELEAIEFDPRAVAASAVEAQRPRAQAAGLELQFSAADALPARVLGDPTRVRQVLLNLLNNAVKFTPRGRVTLVVKVLAAEAPLGVALNFEVSDTGIGMDEATQARLFQPFTQGDSSMTRRYGGSGLGLVISRKLALAMGGTLEAESALGRGSIFRFTVPLRIGAPRVPGGTEAAPRLALPRLSGRVLVVEDDPTNQRVITLLLQRLGVEPVLVGDGAVAVECVTAERWDAVLMDCQLPGLDGWEATRRIRAAEAGARRTPIIALTANARREDREACLAAGMDHFLTKPVRLEELAAVLAERLPRR